MTRHAVSVIFVAQEALGGLQEAHQLLGRLLAGDKVALDPLDWRQRLGVQANAGQAGLVIMDPDGGTLKR